MIRIACSEHSKTIVNNSLLMLGLFRIIKMSLVNCVLLGLTIVLSYTANRECFEQRTGRHQHEVLAHATDGKSQIDVSTLCDLLCETLLTEVRFNLLDFNK